MNNRLIPLLLILLLICTAAPRVINAKNAAEELNEESFVGKFTEALNAKDQDRMVELVTSNRLLAYNVVLKFFSAGVEFTAQGKDGTIFFNSAEAIASVYAREFQKGGLLNLIKRFRLYDIETSKLAVKGQRLVDEGALLYKKALKEEAIYKWMEALKIFENLPRRRFSRRAAQNKTIPVAKNPNTTVISRYRISNRVINFVPGASAYPRDNHYTHCCSSWAQLRKTCTPSVASTR